MSAKLAFLENHRLVSTQVEASELTRLTSDQRSEITEQLEDGDMFLNVTLNIGALSSDQAISAHLHSLLSFLEVERGRMAFGLVIVQLGPAGLEVAEIVDQVKPLVERAAQLDLRVAVRADAAYPPTDLIPLCHSVRRLGIFLDVFRAGSKDLPPATLTSVASPFLYGAAFPAVDSTQPAGQSEPDELRRSYELLWQVSPFPDRLVLEIEYRAGKEGFSDEVFAQSLDRYGTFPPPPVRHLPASGLPDELTGEGGPG